MYFYFPCLYFLVYQQYCCMSWNQKYLLEFEFVIVSIENWPFDSLPVTVKLSRVTVTHIFLVLLQYSYNSLWLHNSTPKSWLSSRYWPQYVDCLEVVDGLWPVQMLTWGCHDHIPTTLPSAGGVTWGYTGATQHDANVSKSKLHSTLKYLPINKQSNWNNLLRMFSKL